MPPALPVLTLSAILAGTLTAADPIRLRVDFAKPDGAWNMRALALGQGGLQSDPMIEPHIQEIRQLRPRTIRLFLSEYYRIYPDHDTYDWTKLDRELRAVCATQNVPLHFLSWHLYSDSPAAHAGNIAKQRARLARFPQLQNVKLFISEWNMDLTHPNLATGFQPCFVLETMRRCAEAGLDMAAYYHIRDCFVDPADFDWMSPGGRRFMAHWWNTMPQYSALFDHHGRVRPAWHAFRLLGQLEGPRYHVEGEQESIRAIAGEGNGYKHLVIWRYEEGGPDELEVTLDIAGANGRSSRIVKLDAAAPVNNIKVIHFGRSDDLGKVPLRLRPWEVRWVEIE